MKRWTFALALALGACTTGQANTTPSISTGGGGGAAGYALQLSVGTVDFNGYPKPAAIGLNVLETFRDANGYTAVPISSATISGPSSLVGIRTSKDPGAHDSGTFPLGSASNDFLIGAGGASTLLAGADGWGMGPPSCSCPGVNFYPMQPQFADNENLGSLFPGGAEPFYGGPPSYPPTQLEASALSALVSIPSSWSEGFYLMGFNSVPSGKYTLRVTYQQNGANAASSASASLNAARILPPIRTFSATPHANGSVDVTVGFPPGVREVIVNAIDSNVPPVPGATCTTGLGFATLIFHRGATGVSTERIPANLGNYGQGGAQTFCENDLVVMQAYGFDYDDYALGPPQNNAQRPSLPAQADVTVTDPIGVLIPGKGSGRRTPRWRASR